jgi:NADPH-dependent 2,4-dienoyl-CoA reductase/sulfur reductase-like enzyme/nitrite reductase/ring-hydroxylating ferredoxin subunit
MAEAERAKHDLRQGFLIRDLADGAMALGQVDGEDAILVRNGDEFFAVGANCTHYHATLSEGLVVGDTVRCPLHHACFSLRSGEALRAPAFDPIPHWRTEVIGDQVFVREKLADPDRKHLVNSTVGQSVPASVVIIGGGAAGIAAADMLRRQGYDGRLTMISADDWPPYDRPNLSKDFLVGNAPDEWMRLRQPEFYDEQKIDLVLNSRVSALDIPRKRVNLENGQTYGFEALLIATGAEPVRLKIEGAIDSQIHYLRTFADARAIVSQAASAKRAAVVGASFIGLEVAASLRTLGIAVDVIAPESQPLERVMGSEISGMIRGLHEAHGVVFHLGETVKRLDANTLTLSGGGTLEVDLVVLGVGVRPSVFLAEQAGLETNRGIVVNEYLETSAPGVFAAGDIARWPDPHSGERIRVEHWVVAERQGQAAAKNILGYRERFDAVPFFWSQHYDVAINYVGHAEHWDSVEIDGDPSARNCAVSYKRGGRTLAVATISRDLQNLQAEAAMEARIPVQWQSGSHLLQPNFPIQHSREIKRRPGA